MKKKSSRGKQKKLDPLSSANWISESSLQSADPATPPQGSGSGSGGPDDCRDCHIDFLEDEVTVDWTDGSYDAADNIDTSGDAWTPDDWSLEVIDDDSGEEAGSETDATIDSQSGKVTFGTIGQSLKITAGVRRCVKCRKKMTLHAKQLSIIRDKKDVTDKTISVYAGETVTLKGRVLPSKFTGSNWEWTVPGDIFKKFKVSNGNQKGERIDYDADAWMKQEFALHWTDGSKEGLDKNVKLKAAVDGTNLTATTTVKVKKPDATIAATVNNARIIYANQLKEWIGTADAKFVVSGSTMGGKTQWIQTGSYTETVKFYDGRTKNTNVAGLDDCAYPYTKNKDALDHPATGFNDTMKKAEFDYQLKMWLMWRHDDGDQWVPLSSCEWWFTGELGPKIPGSAQPVWDSGPNLDNDDPQSEANFPEWSSCLNPNE